MTSLQQAAQAVIAKWDSTYWKDQRATSEYVNTLRVALEAEQAQAVEPVAFRKATSDGFYRYYEADETQPELCEPLYTHPAPDIAALEKALEAEQAQTTHITPLMEQQMFDDWCPYKGNPDPRTVWAAAIDSVNGLTLGATAYPEQAQAVEPVATTMADHIKNECGYCEFHSVVPNGTKLFTHPAPPATGERAELIEKLRNGQTLIEDEVRAADMLEADAKEIERVTEMVHSEKWFADMHYAEKMALKAQQVAVPADAGKAIVRCSIQADQGAGEFESKWDRTAESQKTEWEGIAQAAISLQQVAVPAWTATADKMPKPCTNVLAYNGKKQPIRAMWVPAKTLEDGGDGDFGEYDEATDQTYWPEGWYETNAYEETHWLVDGQVTHWMPLPLPPQGDKP